jgi:hypothetical protein
VGHVVLAIVLWLLSFTVVLWSLFLKGRVFRASWLFALVGAGVVTVSVFLGSGKAVPNNYVPTIDSPLFHLGLLLFFIGFALNVAAYFKDALKGLRSDDALRGAVSASVLIAVVMLFAFAFSVAVTKEAPSAHLFYERLFWIPGHIQQVLNGAMLIVVWYALRKAAGGEAVVQGLILKGANYVLLLSAIVLFMIPVFLDPVARNAKIISEVVYAFGLGGPIFLHAASTLKGIKRRESPVAFTSLLLSMVIYFFGIFIAYSGLGDDLRVPAHYHGAVTGLTLAMMGFSYHIFKGRELKGVARRLANAQPLVYGLGMILFISGLLVAGMMGAPRKTFGVAFASDPAVLTALTVMGIGTIMAVIGGMLYVYCAAASLVKEAR